MNQGVSTTSFIEPNWSRPEFAPSRRRPAAMFMLRNFDDVVPPEAFEPSFTAEDLEVARREGFAEGQADGHAVAGNSRAAAEAAALANIATALAESRDVAAAVADQAAGALAKTLVAALGAVMPDLIRRSALSEAAAMLAHILPGLAREPDIRIEVPADIADGIAAALVPLASEHRGKIDVAGADHLPVAEARVRWAAGEARRQPAQIWEAVMEMLRPALGDGEFKDCTNGN
jgi:flagellar biosynthesis/type III secretory pathway protein FliH